MMEWPEFQGIFGRTFPGQPPVRYLQSCVYTFLDRTFERWSFLVNLLSLAGKEEARLIA